ncbi:DUF2809 domain-containing protein [Bradyrhizobium sp. STM 3843]|uniref:ribosomal maturation YjgA family protein n=1 Tax=Bradyrhizobium sp. STM 3843 TaxID=551947 RepID=UPI00030C7429|nr:DUF2809 domain-containing protein [Bradyrhizobium sp. STM 3843]
MTASPPCLASRAAMLWRSTRALGLAVIVIALGLGLRFYGRGLGVPAFAVKYGGSVLWATMVYVLLAAFAPRLRPLRVAAIALAIAVVVELVRLVHTPWLDSFRLTLAGALLLGRIFSIWNILAYAVGILLAMEIDRASSCSTS